MLLRYHGRTECSNRLRRRSAGIGPRALPTGQITRFRGCVQLAKLAARGATELPMSDMLGLML